MRRGGRGRLALVHPRHRVAWSRFCVTMRAERRSARQDIMVTQQRDHATRRSTHAGLLMALLAAILCAAARVEAAGDPLPDPAETIAPYLMRIEKARVASEPQPAQVAAALREALEALDKAETPAREPLKAVEAAIAREPRKIATRQQAADRMRLRIHLAQAALARGDIYRIAAAALPKGNHDRATDLEQALHIFGALRVEYRDLTVGLLGYLGEARVQRASGETDAAYASLKPLVSLAADPKDTLSQEIRRAAFVELLEVHLATDPKKALAEAASLGAGILFKDFPGWRDRIDYVAARAEAAEVLKAAAKGPLPPETADRPAKATEILRRDGVVRIAPLYDRLALLADLDRVTGEKLLTRDELLAWADVLAATGHIEALDAYRRARAGGPLLVDQSLAYASLLAKKAMYPDVAAVCTELVARMEAAHPQRNAVLEWRAAAMLKMLEAAGREPPAELRTRTLDALRAVFESTADAPVRRDALRQWVAAQSRAGSMAGCVDALLAHQDLVAGDAYLCYSQAAAKWQKLSETMAAGGVDDAVAAAQAQVIVQELTSLEKPVAGQPELAVRTALLRAQVLAGQPLRDARAALAALTAQWDALKADPQTAETAGWLRVEALIELGLAEAASKALAELPDGASPNSPMALLRLADTLAARSADLAPAAQADVQREVLRFCDRAMAMATSSPQSFRTVSERAAKALVAVGAYTNARGILEKLLASPEVRQDAAATLEISLLLAEALLRSSKAEDALKRLDPIMERYPDAARLHLARSGCLAALARHEEAVASARKSRMLARAGSEDWCRATLALAAGLKGQGNKDAAADILRVSEALYPAFGSADLRKKLRAMRESLDGASAPRPSAG